MEYYLFDPSGNITALLPVGRRSECSVEAANRIMEGEPTCEQAGFVLPGEDGCDVTLEMAGGEFCGNASLCTAALFAMERGLAVGEHCSVVLKASGAGEPIEITMTRTNSGFDGTVSMPRIERIRQIALPGAEEPISVAFSQGITHAIVPEQFGMERAEACIRSWCGELKAEAMGIMLVDEASGRLTPLVYVPGSDTLFREHSCASGTAAAGAYLAERAGCELDKSFQEPGGVLSVLALPNGCVTLRNTVRLLRHITE